MKNVNVHNDGIRNVFLQMSRIAAKTWSQPDRSYWSDILLDIGTIGEMVEKNNVHSLWVLSDCGTYLARNENTIREWIKSGMTIKAAYEMQLTGNPEKPIAFQPISVEMLVD